MILDIPAWFIIMTGIGVIFLLIMNAYMIFKYFNVKSVVVSLVNALHSSAMSKDDIEEFVQRQFVIMLKDDELFRKHIEKKVYGENQAKETI